MGSFSIWHWIIVLVVVVLVFGTKKLRNAGSDLGSAIRSFRKGLSEDEPAKQIDAEPEAGKTAAGEKQGSKTE
jgi:sec-independent protein translocase protein TatA